MKIFFVTLLICLQTILLSDVFAQSNECANQLSYKITEVQDGSFQIEVELVKNSSSNFSLELFNLTDSQKLVSEKSINEAQNIIIFRNLNVKHVFLIQAKSTDCKFTLGGMDGIKVENK
jgi:hypothetical protein